MNRFESYPEYKASSADWQGDIPIQWETVALGRLFFRIKRSGFPEEQLLSVYRDHGVVPKNSRSDNFNKPSEDLSPYQLVRENDLVLNKMKAWQGSIAISSHRGIVSPAYFVYEPWRAQETRICPRYIHYLLRNSNYVAQYLRQSKGIRVNQWDLDPKAFERIDVLLPPVVEQTQIARFLDHETARIDTLIEKHQQLIALLEEKRQAVLSHAVTKGLDLDVPMRESGVEWLGKVPAHWKTGMKILRAADGSRGCFVNGPFGSDLLASELQEEGVPVIYIRDIKPGIYSRKSTVCVSPRKATQLAICRVAPGDVLVSKVGDPPGDACVYPRDGEAAIITQDVIRIRVDKENVDPDFLAAVLNSTYGRTAIEDISVESTRKRVSLGDFKQFRFALPPLPEQIEISSAAKKNWASFGKLINSAQMGVDLLQEKRAALISAAVTGKIDVRGWKPPESTSETENEAEAP